MLKYKLDGKNVSIEKLNISGQKIQILGSDFILYETHFESFLEENKLSLESLKNEDNYKSQSAVDLKEEGRSEITEDQQGEGVEELMGVDEVNEEEEKVEVFEKRNLKELNPKLFTEFFDVLSCSLFSKSPGNNLFLCSEEGAMCEIDLNVSQ